MGDATHTTQKTRTVSAVVVTVSSLVAIASAVNATPSVCLSPDQIGTRDVDRTFTQERTLPGLRAPLTSKGRVVVNGTGIVWHMTDPFDVRTTITSDGISQSVNGGLPVSGTTEGATLLKPLSALLRADWTELENMFRITRQENEGEMRWRIILTPYDDHLESVVGSIIVTGCREIDSVEIERGDSDRQTIRFARPKTPKGDESDSR